MIKKLLFLPFILNFLGVSAQTIKTDVLVIGNGPAAVATAVQSAHSKVKTVLAAENMLLPYNSRIVFAEYSDGFYSGLLGEFAKRVKLTKTTGIDSVWNTALKFDAKTADSVLLKMTDSVKNLTVESNMIFSTIEKDGDGWEVKFRKDEKTITIKTRIVVDATKDAVVTTKAGAKPAFRPNNLNTAPEKDLYRTSITTWEAMPAWVLNNLNNGGVLTYPAETCYAAFVPIQSVLVKGAENMLCISDIFPQDSIQYLPLGLKIGQGAGAIAAYCAFFKTTTDHLNVRAIQGELLDFKACLLPFEDIKPDDPDWRAMQQVGVTGILQGEWQVKGKYVFFNFNPGQSVTTGEIRPVLTEIYTRAFLWFNKEKPGKEFTIANMLSFISDYTLTDPAMLKGNIQKAWKTQFKFKSNFELNRPITRREFAVLANKYLNPFARTVDLNGRLMN